MFNHLFANSNFKYHWIAGGIAQTGNFFTVVALPWLVLAITDNDPFIMTSVLATTHLPQSVLMLLGGVTADRLSPLRLLHISRLLGAGVLAALSLCVYLQIIPLWIIYGFALILGILGAINIPAGQAMLPAVVKSNQLGSANGIFIGTLHFAQLLGPFVAGWVIYIGREINQIPLNQIDYSSLAFAFFVDAIAMLVAFILLLKVDVKVFRSNSGSMIKLLKEGLFFCWNDKGIRFVLSYIILISFFIHGPVYCSIPFIAKAKLSLSEAAFGTLAAMTSLGIIFGAGIAMKIAPPGKLLGKLTLSCDAIAGICLYFISSSTSVYLIAAALILMGVCSGTIMIAGTTWFQKRTPDNLMGRVMSVLMFCIMGLIPISALLSGTIIDLFSIQILLQSCSFFVVSIAIAGLLSPTIRNMGAIAGPFSEIKE